MAAKTRKGANGTGDILTVYFDRNDPAERRALEAARLLASKHGRRKQAVLALLEAIYARYEATGELMSASAISSALIGQGIAPGRNTEGLALMSAATAKLPRSAEASPQPRMQRKRQRAGGVELTQGSKSTSETVARNFLSSMKGLASGFFE